MSGAVVAKRYADALFQLAVEKNTVDKLISELETVKEVFKGDENVLEILNHPRISNEGKVGLIDKAFEGFDRDVINTLKILVERNRIDTVILVVDAFIDKYNEENDVAAASVYSVRELSAEERKQVADSLKVKLNKKSISINNIIEPSLLGGLKIRVGNTIYDGSISGKLNRLKHSIGTTTI